MPELLIFVLVGLFVIFIFGFQFYIRHRIVVPPNHAAIVFGRKSKFINADTGEVTIVGSRVISRGNGTMKTPYLEKVIYLDLQTFEVNVEARSVLSQDGVKMQVYANALIKIADDEASIRKAATQFGDTVRTSENLTRMQEYLRETLQGHFRAIISTLKAKELNFEREKFIQQVQKAAGVPLEAMGMEIISFTMSNISDEDGYFEMLKKGTLAATQREQEQRVQKETELELQARKAREMQVDSTRQLIEGHRIDMNKKIEISRIEAETEKTVAEQNRQKDTSVAEKEKFTQMTEQLQEELNLKKVQNERDFLTSELEARRKIRLAQAEGEAKKLVIIGEAEGKRKMAEVYSTEDSLTRLLLVIEEMPVLLEKVLGKEGMASVFREIAQPMSNIKDIRIYDFAGSNGDGTPLTKLAETSPLLIKKLFTMLKDLAIGADLNALLNPPSSELGDLAQSPAIRKPKNASTSNNSDKTNGNEKQH